MTSTPPTDPASPVTPAGLGLFSAVAIIVADMIGTGILTSTGFQAASVGTSGGILALWVIGGVLALCGALTYAELASAMPKSGGEYTYLTQLYHPSVGFLSAWISMFAGFSAPIAAVSVTFGVYLEQAIPGLPKTYTALAVLTLISGLHATSARLGFLFQDSFTILKLLVLGLLAVGGLVIGAGDIGNLSLSTDLIDFGGDHVSTFAVGLVWVAFAYSGWNASCYIASEIRDPKRNIPRSILIGTLLVMALYILLNVVYLYRLGLAGMLDEQGGPRIEIGFLAAQAIFGNVGGRVISAVIAILLISSLSAMTVASSRVVQSVGETIPFFARLSARNRTGAPSLAVLLQYLVALALILTASFESIATYIGLSINFFSMLAVFGVFRLRKRTDLTPVYRTWGYPITPLVFLFFNIWVVIFFAKGKPWVLLASLATILVGLVVYGIVHRSEKQKQSVPPV